MIRDAARPSVRISIKSRGLELGFPDDRDAGLVKLGMPGAGIVTRTWTIPGYSEARHRALGPRAVAGRGKSTCQGSVASRIPGMSPNVPDIAVGTAAETEVAGADEDPAAHERPRRKSRITLSDARNHGERAHSRRYGDYECGH
jgi:hypothetical protein